MAELKKLGASSSRMSVVSDSRNPCKSISCQVGDAFGCSMWKLRLYADRTNFILGSWAEMGSAYLLVFEARGQRGAPLADVISASGDAYAQRFRGNAGIGIKRRWGVAGSLTILDASMTSGGCWIVRRWRFVCTIDEVAAGVLVPDCDNISHEWQESMERANLRGTVRATKLHKTEIDAAVQLSLRSVSALDRPAVLLESMGLRSLGNAVQRFPSDLAKQYYGHHELIAETIADVPRKIEFESRKALGEEGSFGYVDDLGRYRSLDFAREATPFLEYAISMKGIQIWNAYKRGSDLRWSELVEQAAEIKGRAPAKVDYGSSGDRLVSKV